MEITRKNFTKEIVKDKPYIIQYLRPGWVGKKTRIHDKYGTEYFKIQLTRGPRMGVAVAVRDGPRDFQIGAVLLSPREPPYLTKEEKAEFDSPIKGKIEKNLKRRVKNIDWKKAIDLAYLRAITSGGEPANFPVFKKIRKRGLMVSYSNFVTRCAKVFTH